MAVIEGQERVHVEAPADRLYALVSDVTRMGEWSPECRRCEWVDGAEPKVDVSFRGFNQLGWMKWSRDARIVAAEPGREFAFLTRAPGGRKDGTLWRYTFELSGDGTDVTESFEVRTYPWVMRLVASPAKRARQVQEGMRTTLERLKAAAEAG